MNSEVYPQKQRQRAPSQRSLKTRARILDAAETLFAERGFEGASIRDVARAAGVQVGLVHHHGGGKDRLFHQVVARRAGALSAARLAALEARRAAGTVTLRGLVACFFEPYARLTRAEGPHWLAYARLVAHVSADPRWQAIAKECFDPTAGVFIDEIAQLYPQADPRRVATGFVYSVAAMLAHLTSAWRVGALGGAGEQAAGDAAGLDRLIDFCAAGIDAAITGLDGAGDMGDTGDTGETGPCRDVPPGPG